MAATNADVVRRVIHALNADKTNTNATTSTDPAYPNATIQDCVLEGIAQVSEAIIAAPTHGRRAGALTTSATVAHGAQIPAHPGRLLGVTVNDEWLEPLPSSHISRQASALDIRRTNPLKLNHAGSPAFAVTGDNRLLLLGAASALVYFGQYERPVYASYEAFLAGALPFGDEYLSAVFFCAMKIIAQEGENVGAMQAYYNEGKLLLAKVQAEGRPTIKEAQMGLGE